MNTFVRIVRLAELQYEKVKYFSVHIDAKEVNEFFDFLNRMEDIDEIEEDLSNLLVWLEKLGEKYGATTIFFRNEAIFADVAALPPPSKRLKMFQLPVKNIRLYCMVLNEHVVILFNGGIKTAQNAQDCPNVAPYIKQANSIARKIDDLIRSGEITWKDGHSDIDFPHHFELEL